MYIAKHIINHRATLVYHLISDMIGKDLIGLKFSLKSDHSLDSKLLGGAILVNVNPLIVALDNMLQI